MAPGTPGARPLRPHALHAKDTPRTRGEGGAGLHGDSTGCRPVRHGRFWVLSRTRHDLVPRFPGYDHLLRPVCVSACVFLCVHARAQAQSSYKMPRGTKGQFAGGRRRGAAPKGGLAHSRQRPPPPGAPRVPPEQAQDPAEPAAASPRPSPSTGLSHHRGEALRQEEPGTLARLPASWPRPRRRHTFPGGDRPLALWNGLGSPFLG